jgi:hypothetical protein
MSTDALLNIMQKTRDNLYPVFRQMDWAEEEIAQARQRHPTMTDTLYHSFTLLTPTHDLMKTEVVYRAHCRELLDRVASVQDTRPGTAIEVCCACSATSALAPLTSPAAGLYMRTWTAAGLPELQSFDDRHGHHEALEGPIIDDLEREARRKLTVADRRLGTIDCPGRHHGEPVPCKYAEPAQLTLAV